jgi:hypothetical protein
VWHSVSGALLAGIFNAADALVGRKESADNCVAVKAKTEGCREQKRKGL